MAKSKNIQRDEQGHAILAGAKTFGEVVRPGGGRRQPRSCRLKDQAADRLVSLMTGGGDTISAETVSITDRDEMDALQDQNNFARLPLQVRMAYFVKRMEGLYQEIFDLEAGGNRRKVEFKKPAIEMEIEWVSVQVKEIMAMLKEQRRLVSREVSNG